MNLMTHIYRRMVFMFIRRKTEALSSSRYRLRLLGEMLEKQKCADELEKEKDMSFDISFSLCYSQLHKQLTTQPKRR